MIEEIPRPHIQGPRIMLSCIAIGMVTGFISVSCLLFVIVDVDQVVASPSGPLLQIFMDATKSRAGSTCLLMLPLGCMLFASIPILCTSSRMTYALARDRGMPLSSVFAKVHPTLDVPMNALLWTTGWVVIFGLVLLGSSSALSAIVSASVVSLGVTYAIPPAIHVLRGRNMLPETRPFKLNGWVGWTLNLVCMTPELYRAMILIALPTLGGNCVDDFDHSTVLVSPGTPGNAGEHELLHCGIRGHSIDCWHYLVAGWPKTLQGPECDSSGDNT